MTPHTAPAHLLILGGARSGKSAAAEAQAAGWLAADPAHEALLLATALPADGEMAARIARHRADRALRLPALRCIEVPLALPEALAEWAGTPAAAQRLLVVDCLTLWLTQCLLPPQGEGLSDAAWLARQQALLHALAASRGPVVLVSNEIGLGVLPLHAQARRCVDALGRLHQALAAACPRVMLMVAGLPLLLKGAP